jgi:hypothetical protein
MKCLNLLSTAQKGECTCMPITIQTAHDFLVVESVHEVMQIQELLDGQPKPRWGVEYPERSPERQNRAILWPGDTPCTP